MKALAPALLIFSAGLLVVEGSLQKLLWTTLGLLFLLKLAGLIRNHLQSVALPKGLGLFVFLFMWPGMRPEVFASRGVQNKAVGKEFVSGFLFFLLGLFLQVGLIIFWNRIHAGIRPYLGLASFLLLIHFGLSSLSYSIYRMCGWPVEKLFREPLKSTSLKDFWGQRWNIPFVDLNKRLIFPLFPKKSPKILLVIGIFLTSGLLHEMAISYPSGAGWGTPMLYFALHGFLTSTEDYLPWKRLPPFAKRVWLWSVLLIPIPLLFHSPFLETFINPYFAFFHQVYDHLPLREWLNWGLIACGLGHLLVLVASSQVPKKLEWKEDFAHLSTFNRKIFWTYGGYIVFCILFFAVVDLSNSEGLLDQHLSSMALCAFIALFWTVRVIVDFTYFKHHDWPTGDLFVVGHTLLTTLFFFLALTHWAALLFQLA